MTQPVIVSAVRTPIGKFMGSLSNHSATELGSLAIAASIARSGVDPARIEKVILGNVVSAGLGQNPARQAALGAGLPVTVSALGINKVCGSGLKAVALAAQAIRAGDALVVVAGGMESMSGAPHLLHGIRNGLRLGAGELKDAVVLDGLWCAMSHQHMGMTAELATDKYHISRQEQDAFSLLSHERALAAIDAGHFASEIVPVEIKERKGETRLFDTDECPRRDTSLERLGSLRPAFKKDGGSVTAGNAPGLNDGAAALVVTDEAIARENGWEILAAIDGYAVGGVSPEWVMIAPVQACRNLFKKLGRCANDFDLVEANEAFAAQALAVCQELEFDPERVNVHGGSVALGHPIGASGARILTTLIHALKTHDKETGLATLCLGGGEAVSLAIRRM